MNVENIIKKSSDILRDVYKKSEYVNILIPAFLIRVSSNDLCIEKDSVNTMEDVLNLVDRLDKDIKAILDELNFYSLLRDMDKKGLLEIFIEDVKSEKWDISSSGSELYSAGNLYEEIIRKTFINSVDENGAFFTSEDISLLINELIVDSSVGKEDLKVYDPTIGTAQMAINLSKYIEGVIGKSVDVYGQEINKNIHSMAKINMLLSKKNHENIAHGSTLSDDGFKENKFDYIISNPPFGVNWSQDKKKVVEESLSNSGRFSVGLPKISDGQLLFMLNNIHKLKDTGRMAIIHNGSALFSGSAGGGESAIRQHVIENDWLEAIVQLPTDLFYNTGISTYVWLITKNKPAERQGKVQLIDASKCYEKLRKNIGNKRVDINESARKLILQAYGEFKNQEYHDGKLSIESKLFNNNKFGYTKVVVESPRKKEDGSILLRKGKKIADTKLRDTENIPLNQDIDAYFEKEVLPFNPDAWMDRKKDKIGYEIPFTRYFYEYQAPEPSDKLLAELYELEEKLQVLLEGLR